jgi:hypothetical protein
LLPLNRLCLQNSTQDLKQKNVFHLFFSPAQEVKRVQLLAKGSTGGDDILFDAIKLRFFSVEVFE